MQYQLVYLGGFFIQAEHRTFTISLQDITLALMLPQLERLRW